MAAGTAFGEGWLDEVAGLLAELPGLWLLVPGATALIGVTELVGGGTAAGAVVFAAAVVGIVSIGVGALTGSVAYQAMTRRAARHGPPARAR